MRPKMGLMDDDSLIAVNGTRAMIGLVETSNIVSPNELCLRSIKSDQHPSRTAQIVGLIS